MIHHVTIPRIGSADAWRTAARGLLANAVEPDQVTWGDTATPRGLFDARGQIPAGGEVTVPRSFIQMANSVVWHADAARFAWLYAFLWRLRDAPHLMTDRGDADLARLRRMEKNVHRCQHKMKAFVRFREIGEPDAQRRSFAAWFEPTHHTVEPTAQFFLRRFGDMDWRIYSPDVSVICNQGVLTFLEDQPNPQLPDDANEQLWVTYFRNIFNPARLKVQAMQSEMPKKYWKNIPEAAVIPDLIAQAPARARAMAEAAPTLPPRRTGRIMAQQAANVSAWTDKGEGLVAAIKGCNRCHLHKTSTQAVTGEGPRDANLMIVGEQPGDIEDLQGRPFVGPAGQLFDDISKQAGLDRRAVFVTNAVKHFKFQARGRRRIHQRPVTDEISKCRWWLAAEITDVRPSLIVAMGATAAEALTGSGIALLSRRGTLEATYDTDIPVLITIHPSYLLRLTDMQEQKTYTDFFRTDLQKAVAIAG